MKIKHSRDSTDCEIALYFCDSTETGSGIFKLTDSHVFAMLSILHIKSTEFL